MKIDNYFLKDASMGFRIVIGRKLAEIIRKYGKVNYRNKIYVAQGKYIYFQSRGGPVRCHVEDENDPILDIAKEEVLNDAGTRTDESGKD